MQKGECYLIDSSIGTQEYPTRIKVDEGFKYLLTKGDMICLGDKFLKVNLASVLKKPEKDREN
jgi:hypothetical protein